jgi:hypothetical protein
MQPGREEPGDTVFMHEGRVVLVVDAETATAMSEQLLDVDTDGEVDLCLLPLPRH